MMSQRFEINGFLKLYRYSFQYSYFNYYFVESIFKYSKKLEKWIFQEICTHIFIHIKRENARDYTFCYSKFLKIN